MKCSVNLFCHIICYQNFIIKTKLSFKLVYYRITRIISMPSFTSAFGEYFFGMTDHTSSDCVYGLHGYRTFGSASQVVNGVRRSIGINVYLMWLVVVSAVSQHVSRGNGVRSFDWFPLDQNSTGRYGVHVEFWRWRRI